MGIVAKYNFARGNSQDLSGNAYHGTDTNISYANGGIKSAYFNTNANSYIILPNINIPILRSYGIIFKNCNINNNGVLIKYDRATNNYNYDNTGVYLWQNNVVEYGEARYRNINNIAANIHNTNEWNHIIITFGNNTIRFYLDGVLMNNTTVRRIGTYTTQWANIGRHYNTWDTRQYISDVYITLFCLYNHELSPSEIKNNYAFNKGFF